MWGAESSEAQAQLQRSNGRAHTLRRLGYELENTFGLKPVWSRQKDVRFWFEGMSECLDVAEEHGYELVLKAAQKLRKDHLNIATPKSLVNTTRALAAEKRSKNRPKHIVVRR